MNLFSLARSARTSGISFLLAGSLVATSWAAPLKIELPQESPAFKPLPGAELAMSQCLICHSSEYITTQPPLSRATWKATVEKMQHKFGAPLQAEQVEALVDYLTKAYGAAPASPPPASPAK
jgi:mono/diheme cytochrome c family protein